MNTGTRARDLRVMIVTDQYAPMVGGVPTVTRELARGLSDRGHAVAVVAPGPTWRGQAGTEGGRVTVDFRGSVPWPWYAGQRLGLLPPSRARELIAAFAPDVVHVHSPLTLGAAARSAARRRHTPVVYTNHYLPVNVWPASAAGPAATAGTGPAATGFRVLDAAFYAYVTGFASRCDLVTAPTLTALRLLRGHRLRVPSRVVSNGVDRERFSPGPRDERLRATYGLPSGRPLILSVGRLSPEKRTDVLIGAMARLAGAGGGKGPAGSPGGEDTAAVSGDPVLVLAGAGPDLGRLRALARHYGIAERVRFLGFVSDEDLPGLYRLADVFAIASQAELQSLVTMAAMASGLPVAAVAAGALAELVQAGENGFLVRPGHAGELADCLRLLCRDAGLRARMSRASARIIADHDRHRVLGRWESIYRALAFSEGSDTRETGEAFGAGEARAAGPSRPDGQANETAAEQAKVSDGQP
ncbi:MAG TPA: glycosyltransferase [Trebonia sp.]|nr:glycosyltransferase [Trebonia sp.]